ncbi:hypothetical protein QTL95_19975 [Rhizobium sp. S152]|uniref:hypothetical protein n=1 Tax=Rhizobium sp. S152 TaxID=3055038 RepID=UPI0025A9B6BD|nr:hypothetical protein [Rhizobium sp. S152]MDM9628174.1 hypothetical protein [Rhizobium sp. S152]
MSPTARMIAQEVALSALILAVAVIGLPRFFDPGAPVNYPLALGVFVLMSLAFAAYELLVRRR